MGYPSNSVHSDKKGQASDNGRDSSLMMTAIPRRPLPPRQSPTEADITAEPSSDAIENMTIPRRRFSSQPPTDSNGVQGGNNLQGQENFHSRMGEGSDRTGGFDRRMSDVSDRGGSSSRPSRPRPKHVTIQSESPFIVKIKMRGVTMDHEALPRFRASGRTPKRVRPSYEEVPESDFDDLVDSDDEDFNARPKKLRRSSHGSSLEKGPAATSSPAVPIAPSVVVTETTTELDPGSGGMAIVPAAGGSAPVVDAPPPGWLNTLWYSRECFIHVFVAEKIVGWKRRHLTSLEWDDPDALRFLDPIEATNLQQKVLTNQEFWNDQHKRMEVSRINVTQCPVVMTIASEREKASAEENNVNPKFKLDVSLDQTEEVLLVKWRGKSHLHCSWERPSDIQKLDPSNTARHKIRRYYQSQEIVFGRDWKKIVEEERATAVAIHSHGEAVNADTIPDQADEGEEFFPPQCVEVERILACDEKEMDPQVQARQRALNIKAEQDALARREEAEERTAADNSQKLKSNPLIVEDLVDIHKEEEPWDPEDNVRYVVKWKGLPFAEITWEYWRDIKRDAVDQCEDFWYRQKPPSPEEIKRISNKPHPHVRDFRKMPETKVYGKSSRARPVANLGDGAIIPEDDEAETEKAGFQLRSYQLEGVNWLLFNWWNKRSCILADEMGLGKTVQTLGFLQELRSNPHVEVRGPFLIVAPLSLIGQWQSEADSWAPDFNVVVYHGSADARKWVAQQEFYYLEEFVGKPTATKLRKQHITKFHILITTYEVALKDIDVISKIRWKTLIVDEAHRLKNPTSRLFAELASVPRDYCVLLTGTPLANHTEELWALLHFADPKAFHDRDDFMEKFGQLSDSSQVSELHSILKPYLLRRVKEDVEKSLPPKEETILEVSLTPIQKQYYKAIYERNTTFLYKGAKPNNAPSLMNVMMELRKICNHPYLVKGLEDKILADASAKAREQTSVDSPIDYAKLFGQQLVKSSGKMVLLEKLLLKLFNAGHKVLIFSQMVRALDLLEELLKVKRYRYERLDGSTSSSSRAAAVDRFKRKSCQRFVMLLSTRAGGLGLNLTTADIVIIFDSDWNPQNDLQAMARAHRIGQTKKVQIFRLLTAKTYEMHMFHSASMKLGLERAVLSQQRNQEGDETDEASQKKAKSDKEAHAKEIDELLKKGAYDVFRDEDDEEARKFMETDIDQLLERNAKTVTYGASADSLGSGLGSFSKASFVTDTGDGEKDVDLDDPDFWSKAVGLEAPLETPEDLAQMIDDGVKRSRKQVQQFDPYAEARMAEQLKQEKIAMQLQAEKEEKERLRLEKKKRKKETKEKRKLERDETQSGVLANKPPSKNKPEEAKEEEIPKKVASKDFSKAKKMKKSDRRRALKRAANEDPMIERLKQGWEVAQRNRATAAVLRFGFGRFNKMRHESNLTSLPLQDLEIFTRSYTYQLTLQVAVSFLSEIQKSGSTENRDFRSLVKEWMGPGSESEVDWLCTSVFSVLQYQFEVQSCRRFLRMPPVLAETSYMSELRQGAAFRGLRRMGLLARLNRFVERCLDSVLSVLGHEELAKRGCGTNDLSTLDSDLRARHVSTEELSLAAGVHYRKNIELQPPAAWWDRNCDIALIIGTFVHGLGNYEAMRNDEDLPFGHNITTYAETDKACCAANRAFQAAAAASKGVFDVSLERAKAKAASEVQAAVAKAAASASEREQDALALRQGGAAAGAVLSNLFEPAEEPMSSKSSSADDLHFVTLPRLQQEVIKAVHDVSQDVAALPLSNETVLVPIMSSDDFPKNQVGEVGIDVKKEDDRGVSASSVSEGILVSEDILAMPDSRILNRRFIELLNEIEASLDNELYEYTISEAGNRWEANGDVLTNREVRSHALLSLYVSKNDLNSTLSEYSGVGLSGVQCGTSHRSLDDGSDYSVGAASSDLFQIAHGTDAPRYLRAIGVPMNLTRFAISALVYADMSTLQQMLSNERLRNNMRRNSQSEVFGSSEKPHEWEKSQDVGNAPKSDKQEGIREGNQETQSPAKTTIENGGTSSVALGGSESNQNTATGVSMTLDSGIKQEEPPETKKAEAETSKREELSYSSGPPKDQQKEFEQAALLEDKEEDAMEVEHRTKDDRTMDVKQSLKPADNIVPMAEGSTEDSSHRESQKIHSAEIKTDATEGNGLLRYENKEDLQTQEGAKDHGSKGKAVRESDHDAHPASRSAAPPPPLDPAEILVALPFRANSRLRAAVSSAILLYGYPTSASAGLTVDGSLWTMLRTRVGTMGDNDNSGRLFSMLTFINCVQSLIPDEKLPETEIVQSYVEKVLLPHCLRLCVQGNGPSARNARGSKGEYETAFGVSQYPEPSKEVQSPLPDPCLPLWEQSLEAVAYSCAILRRVRLMRSALCIASGHISIDQLEQASRSSFMCKNLDGLPLWWCPWIHDVALLVHAATRGLFAIVRDHYDDIPGSAFSRKAIVHVMCSNFMTGQKMIPTAITERSGSDDADEWIQLHAKEFPSVHVLERRLAFLCSQATTALTNEIRYDNLPMFDHGGWPRI